jgi:hypothetical protein
MKLWKRSERPYPLEDEALFILELGKRKHSERGEFRQNLDRPMLSEIVIEKQIPSGLLLETSMVGVGKNWMRIAGKYLQ